MKALEWEEERITRALVRLFFHFLKYQLPTEIGSFNNNLCNASITTEINVSFKKKRNYIK